jgi:hypothetical protein
MSKQIEKDAYVIIIGAMKAGTTSLYNYLQDHPQICPAVIKEPEFFSENQRHGIRSSGIQVSEYTDLWSFDGAVHKYALEASTGYTRFPEEPNVPRRIFEYGIKPKFIYVVRDPYSRILSHRNFIKNRAYASKVSEAYMITLSNYFLQLEQYRKYFPIEDFLIVDFDALKSDPISVLRDVYGFLDLSADYVPEKFGVYNPTRGESKFEEGLRKTKLKTSFRYIPKPLKRLGTNILGTLPPHKDSLTDLEKQSVYDQLKEDMAGLYHIYGFNVRSWGFSIDLHQPVLHM